MMNCTKIAQLQLFGTIFALSAGTLLVVANIEDNKTPKNINDVAGDKFAKCCNDKGITCPEVCTYPPPDFSLAEQWCMFTYLSDFIECYTGGHNNTKCCEEHGVKGIYGICRDFCDGTTSHSWDVRYMVCGAVKENISKCNHGSI